MCSFSFIILFAFVAPALFQKLPAIHSSNVQELPAVRSSKVHGEMDKVMDKLIDKLADKFFNGAEKKSLLNHPDMDNTTLGQLSHLANPSQQRLNRIYPLCDSLASAQRPHPRREAFPCQSSKYQWPGDPDRYSTRYQTTSDGAFGRLPRRDSLVAVLGAALALLPPPAFAREAYLNWLHRAYNPKQLYKNFKRTKTGLLFKDIQKGNGDGKKPSTGDRCVIDWTGCTAGYNTRYVYTFGWRKFEQGRDANFDYVASEKDLLKFAVGDGTIIPAIEEGVLGMSEGGVRQLVVEDNLRRPKNQPSLGYPEDDPTHDRVGPKPTSFAGQRALKELLENEDLIDKTLLFNVRLIRVDKPGENGWKPEEVNL